MILTLPNVLTILRLAAAPAIAFCFVLLPRPIADWIALFLFIGASLTDWFDGYIARSRGLVSRLGTMLDPIADKAMVVIALMVLARVSSLGGWLLIPASLILFREVFVSGLREFLGNVAGTLKVTKLAKWKTATQMVAIVVLLIQGGVEQHLALAVFGMDADVVDAVLSGRETAHWGLGLLVAAHDWTTWGGIALVWIAAILTVITGADYFLKARPYLRD